MFVPGSVFHIEDFRVRGGVIVSLDDPEMGAPYVSLDLRGTGQAAPSPEDPVTPFPVTFALSAEGARELSRRLSRLADLIEVDPSARTQDQPPRPSGSEWAE